MTRFDNIKSMNDWEFSEFLLEIEPLLPICQYKQDCLEAMKMGHPIFQEKCVDCCKEWLREDIGNDKMIDLDKIFDEYRRELDEWEASIRRAACRRQSKER